MNPIDTLCLRIVQLLQENEGLRMKLTEMEKKLKKEDLKKGLKGVN